MITQQWEFCQLGLYASKEHKSKQGKVWSYNCWARYYGPTESKYYQLSELDRQVFQVSPFAKAMGLLGAAGWELVSIQHGNLAGGPAYVVERAIVWDNVVAYFKRPVEPGRPVDEPKLVMQDNELILQSAR